MIEAMRACVFDASVVVRAFFNTDYSDASRAVLEELCDSRRAIAPDLLYVECASAVWKYVRFRNLPSKTADQIIDDILQLDIRTVSIKGIVGVALRIANMTKVSVYDACYVATALSFDATLVSADVKLIRQAAQSGAKIVHIADFGNDKA